MGNWQSRETLSPHRISLSLPVGTNLLSTPFSERPRTERNQALVVWATLSGVKALAEMASEQKVPRLQTVIPGSFGLMRTVTAYSCDLCTVWTCQAK